MFHGLRGHRQQGSEEALEGDPHGDSGGSVSKVNVNSESVVCQARQEHAPGQDTVFGGVGTRTNP